MKTCALTSDSNLTDINCACNKHLDSVENNVLVIFCLTVILPLFAIAYLAFAWARCPEVIHSNCPCFTVCHRHAHAESEEPHGGFKLRAPSAEQISWMLAGVLESLESFSLWASWVEVNDVIDISGDICSAYGEEELCEGAEKEICSWSHGTCKGNIDHGTTFWRCYFAIGGEKSLTFNGGPSISNAHFNNKINP